jgi:enoyl-CoA hydratase
MVETLLVEQRGRVLVLTVNRPECRNALDPPTLLLLADALTAAVSDGTRAMVLTGAGDIAFGSGMDLRSLRDDRDAAAAAVTAFRRALEHDDRPPMVAAVNGDAMGGGFELMLRCELVVAAETARFGLPEVSHGLVPGSGATLLPTRIPIAIAMELVLTTARIDAARAAELGLVNRVVPRGEMLEAAIALAQSVAVQAPLAVSGARRALWASLDGVERGWSVTADEVARISASEDMREGIAAFLARRPPRWQGR